MATKAGEITGLANVKKAEEKNVFGKLTIDKIRLEKEIFPLADKRNDIDYNIELLYINKDQSQYIIVGHSGNGEAAYFNDIDQLSKGDVAKIEFEGNKQNFVYDKRYKIVKGESNSLKINKEAKLILISCDKKEKDKFLVIELVLQ